MAEQHRPRGEDRTAPPTGISPGGTTTPRSSRPLPAPRRDTTAYPRGAAAIRPRHAPGDPATPAFTAQEVAAYVEAHPIADRVGRETVVTVARVEFLPRRAFPRRYPHLRPLAPDEALLCVVTLRGTFRVPAPPPVRAQSHPRTTDIAWQVFDAHTGNLLTEAIPVQESPDTEQPYTIAPR